MATMTVSDTDRRDGKALALFASCDLWQTGRTKDGRSFFAIPGSEPNLFHMTDTRNCSCPDRQQRLEVCKHMRAVRLWTAAFKTGAVSPKREAAATSQDDRAVLLPAGAAYLAEQSAPAADEPAVTAPTAWHYCTRGCGELLPPENTKPLCDHCFANARHLLGSDD